MANTLAEKILVYIEKNSKANSYELAVLWNEDHQKIVGAVKSLQSLGEVGLLVSQKPWSYFIYKTCITNL